MNCREIQDLLTPYLLGDLEPAQAADVRAHLQTCELCRNSVEDLQATLQLLREGLKDTAAMPLRLPETFILQFKKRRWRRPRISKPKPAPRRWWVSVTQYAAVAAVLLILAGLMLPNLSSVREKARRVNDLSNLNGIWKSASAWGLNPSDSFRPAFPPSLDELAKEANLPPEMLVNPETGKPIEYYPGARSSDGDRPLLVSHGKGGMNVVKVTGQGMWVADGTPEAVALTRQLAGLPKQVASVPKQTRAKGPRSSVIDYWKDISGRFLRSSDDSQKVAIRGSFDEGAVMVLPPSEAPPPPPKAKSIADANFKQLQSVRSFQKSWGVSGGESGESRGGVGSVYEVSESPSAGKDEYASAAHARSDKSADALRLKESEGTEREEESAKPLEFAALSSIRRDSSRLTADIAGPPTMPKQETEAETKEVRVTTTAAAVKTAVTRITVAAPA
ncbi:MAG: zf-HC2 domain-containing protein, partial [Verrucomicrobia bacterium]|nr:zf-HC2 domain-containing protein [Verrucomicrobiota bacterium]